MIEWVKEHKIITIILIVCSIYFYINYLRPVSINENIDKNSELYINDLYQSDGLHYNNLNKKEQALYNEILKSYKDFSSDITIDLKKYGCNTQEACDISIRDIWDAIMLDHPELLQLAGISYEYSDNSSKIEMYLNSGIYLDFQYYLGVMRIERIIDDIRTATKVMDDKEKVKYVYEWIGSHNSYDRIFTYSSKNQSAYSVFIKHSGICSAYAKASQIIFQNIGIESYVLRGRSTGEHMWNIVKVDGNYYYYDSTVASCVSEDNDMFYDGLKQSYLKGFTVYNSELYPKTSDEEYLTTK